MITNEGLNYCLDVAVHDAAKVATWYVGLIHSTNYSTLAAGDTMSSHAGWEEDQNYSESVRQTWTEGAASSQQTTNATVMTFTMNASTTIKGIFVCSDSTKGGSTGTLLATKLLDGGDRTMSSGQLLKITLTINADDAT